MTRTKTPAAIAVAALALTLGGCSSLGGIGDLFGAPRELVRLPESDNCGAQKLSYHLGHGLSPDVERDIAARSAGHEVRYIKELYRGNGDPKAQRLDVYYYGDNRVINAIVCS